MKNNLFINDTFKQSFSKGTKETLAPLTVSDRNGTSIGQETNKFVFISYSHKDSQLVFADLQKLWGMNANYWYDRELVKTNNNDDWDSIAHAAIMNENCVGMIFYVSKHSFLSQAVYREIEACKKRLEDDESFLYKVILLEGSNLIDIQNSCDLPLDFTSKRLINIHDLWGTEKLYLRYSATGDHFYDLAEWFIQLDCINDIHCDTSEYAVVRDNYLLLGTSLISYFGSDCDFKLEPHDIVTEIKAIASPTIEEIVIPEGVTRIENFAIVACPRLKSIYIPSTVEEMEYFALANFNFSKIVISENNRFFATDEYGFVYHLIDGKPAALFAAPNKNQVKKLVIADSVISVNDFAISYCDYLEEVIFSKQLKHLGYWSVKGNKCLRKITLHNNIQSISPFAFIDTNIQEIVFVGTKKEWETIQVNDDDTLATYFKEASVSFCH